MNKIFNKNIKNKVLSSTIILIVLLFLFINAGTALSNSFNMDNNIGIVEEALHKCEPVAQNYSDKKVILRLDDIQASAYTRISQIMIEDAAKINMKLVLGVIPNKILTDGVIDRTIKDNLCNIEVAMHGYTHVMQGNYYEFEDVQPKDYAEINYKLENGKSMLEQLTGSSIVTFIPPGNKLSEYVKNIILDKGIKYISSDNEQTQFDMTISTFEFDVNKLTSVSDIIKTCNEKFSEKSVCVIVLHPQDYLTNDVIDSDKYSKYWELLSKLREDGVYSTTFSEIQN